MNPPRYINAGAWHATINGEPTLISVKTGIVTHRTQGPSVYADVEGRDAPEWIPVASLHGGIPDPAERSEHTIVTVAVLSGRAHYVAIKAMASPPRLRVEVQDSMRDRLFWIDVDRLQIRALTAGISRGVEWLVSVERRGTR